jgi:asparagine synthase (glutamine-hydrolysing)
MRSRLPDEVIGRKKKGFGCPVGAWFRGELRPMVADLLSAGSIRRRGIFDPGAVQRAIDAHHERREDYSELLLSLLTFELWARDVLDR